MVLGWDRTLVRPQPQKKVPKRTGMGLPSASAVPLPSRKQSSSGSATMAAEPWNMPRRSDLRLKFMISTHFFVSLRAVLAAGGVGGGGALKNSGLTASALSSAGTL